MDGPALRAFEDLRSDQQACIDELYNHHNRYVVMRMGGGKTATCLTAVSELIADGHCRRAVVLAPPLVAATVWPAEPAKWQHLQHLRVEALTGGPARRLKRLQESDAHVLTVSDESAKWLFEELLVLPEDHPLKDIFIYDEPKLKNPRGKIGKGLAKIAPCLKNIWLLSGTPRPNGYEDLFMPARVLMPSLWGHDFDDWRRRNFMRLDPMGYRWEPHDFRVPALDAATQKFMVRAAEPADARHGTLTSGPDYDFEFYLPDDIAEGYAKMEKKFFASFTSEAGEIDIAALTAAIASAKLSQLVQGFIYDTDPEGGSPAAYGQHDGKIDALQYQLDAIGAESAVICYGYQYDLQRLEELMKAEGRSYGVLGDGRPTKHKLRDIELWNEGKLDNLLLHPTSAGHGVELQHGGRRLIWYCPTWSAEQYDQTIKRLDRPGQTKQVYSHQIIAKDTIDEVKRNRVHFKMSAQDAFKTRLRQL